MCVCVCVFSHFSYVQLLATLWTVTHKVPISMGFSRQEHWSGLPCPPLGDFPNTEIEPEFLTSPALERGFFTIITSYNYVVSLCGRYQHNIAKQSSSNLKKEKKRCGRLEPALSPFIFHTISMYMHFFTFPSSH